MSAFLQKYGIAIFVLVIVGVMVTLASPLGSLIENTIHNEVTKFTDTTVEDYENGEDNSNVIPEGGIYTATNGTVYNAGEEFPTTMTNGDVYTYGDYKYTIEGVKGNCIASSETDFINCFKTALGATTDEEWQTILTSQGITEEQLIQMGYGNGMIGINDYSNAYCEVSVIDKTKSSYSEMLKTINNVSVTTIAESGFINCVNLISYNIPSNISVINDSVFNSCTSLTSITIPNSVTSIGRSAFAYCSSLTSIEIPKDCYLDIGNYAFKGCTSLTSITIPKSVTSIGNNAFDSCRSLTSITIPNSVTSIGNNSFMYCSSLTSITIPDGVTSIGEKAFQYCTNLTSIIIPDSVTSISNEAFYNCKSLTSVVIGNSVKNIGDYAFSSDITLSLTSIIIPNSVTNIGKKAFGSNSILINYLGTKAEWSNIEKHTNWGYPGQTFTINCTDESFDEYISLATF